VPDIQMPSEPRKITSHRLMLAVVIFLGVLIVIAVCVMIVGLVMKFSGKAQPHTAEAGSFALPPDARVVEMQSQPSRLILHIHSPSGDEIDIVDIDDGHIVSRIKASK